jgi:hypothetical protein
MGILDDLLAGGQRQKECGRNIRFVPKADPVSLRSESRRSALCSIV